MECFSSFRNEDLSSTSLQVLIQYGIRMQYICYWCKMIIFKITTCCVIDIVPVTYFVRLATSALDTYQDDTS